MSAWNAFCRTTTTALHTKCRNAVVPDNFVSWTSEWAMYRPPDYTDSTIIGKPWADSDFNSGTKFLWNSVDGNINRVSYICTYDLDWDLRPMNPMGRTGLRGRGVLGRWGPNHAADPLVTRIHKGKLQFVAIKRRDSGLVYLYSTLIRQPCIVLTFNIIRCAVSNASLNQIIILNKGKFILRQYCLNYYLTFAVSVVLFIYRLKTLLSPCLVLFAVFYLFNSSIIAFRGYVDDPRNTDNAWMETIVVNFHDTIGILSNIDLHNMARRAPPQIDGLYSLKIDNISYNTTQADLRRMFDKYGEIGDIHIPRDKYTRQSKGFGFVRFYRPIDERGSGRGRDRSRSPRRRSRSRSPRYSRSRSPPSRRSRSNSRSSRRSRSGSPLGKRTAHINKLNKLIKYKIVRIMTVFLFNMYF
uniref:RRM domain-containing protein n=1 Tax=Heterorhabditis bacteriophora TaxID=37862 RepID=A0A1I7WSK3_HETBA